MNKNIVVFLLLVCFFWTADAAYVLRGGKMVNVKHLSNMSSQGHFDKGLQAIENKKWNEATIQFRTVIKSFPNDPLFLDSCYYLALGLYETGHPDLASNYLSEYLDQAGIPKFYQGAWEYKFKIAEKYRKGARKHFLGREQLPKIISARNGAIEIYNEIIEALPGHDIAIQSMLAKGELLEHIKEYEDAITVYHEIIHKFNDNQLATQSYMNIARLYYEQCQRQSNDFDLLDLSKTNLRRFKVAFSENENISTLENYISEMEEIYAKEFYEVAKFYVKTKKNKSAAIYYHNVIQQFPNTKVAKDCNKQLNGLNKEVAELNLAVKDEAIS